MFKEELLALGIKKPPGVVGKYAGKPLILAGSGHCLWRDMEPFHDKGWDYMAVNYAGLLFPYPLSHWSSQEINPITYWVELRRINKSIHGLTEDFLFHSHSPGPKVDVVWDSHRLTGGTSAWGAAVYATLMGYDPIILVGVPLDNWGNFYDAPYAPKDQTHGVIQEQLRSVWQWGQDNIFKGKVKSMSGLTRDICGEAI